jgi:hypothetical protein
MTRRLTEPGEPAVTAGPAVAVGTAEPAEGCATPTDWGVRLVFPVSFAVMLTLLLVRSRELFSRVIYEEGDLAANSILTYQAKHFDLLVGNYSRIGFSHPGPGYFYLQAFGEWLLYDLLHLVPSPWNGHAVAIFSLNAACLALVLTVIQSWFRSWTGVVAAAGVALAYLAGHGDLVTSTWMPHAYFAPFLVLLVAAASVAAGRTRHLWMLTLAGCLLVHGHAEFLFFVPLIAGTALLPHWRRLPRIRSRRPPPVQGAGRDWLLALGILAIFLLPIVLNLALRWPGEFAKYFAYGGERSAHPLLSALHYDLEFWADNRNVAVAAVIVLFAGVLLLGRLGRAEEYGPLLLAAAGITGLAAGLFVFYSCYGIDQLSEKYVGIFSRAMPVALVMLASAGGVTVLPRIVSRLAGTLRAPGAPRTPRRGPDSAPRVVATATLVVGLVAAALSGGLVNRRPEVPDTAHALDVMAERANGRPIVLDVVPPESWSEATPLVIGGIRRDLRVCMSEAEMRLFVTSDYICTPDDLANGARFVVSRPSRTPPHTTLFAGLYPSIVLTRVAQ